MKTALIKTDVGFNVGDKKVKFSVVHNLPETRGVSFNDALTNWIERTEYFTAASLCRYIEEKDPTVTCMTMKAFNRLSKIGT